MHVLRKMVEAVKPGGLVLDLQVIRPNPTAEVDGQVICEIDGEPLFRTADAATEAIEALINAGRLVEQAVDDHDVRKHYANGAELVADFADKKRRLPDHAVPRLLAVAQPCAVRERCRLRRLQVRWRLGTSRRRADDPIVAVSAKRRTLEELLDTARAKIERTEPVEAFAATEQGALVIDIRADVDRERDGIVSGSLHIPRTVLEWRLDPDSPFRNPHVGGLDQQILLLCDHGAARSVNSNRTCVAPPHGSAERDPKRINVG